MNNCADTVQQTVADFTHKVDERTASADKPGLITQLTSAVQKVTDKADAYIGSVSIRSPCPPPMHGEWNRTDD